MAKEALYIFLAVAVVATIGMTYTMLEDKPTGLAAQPMTQATKRVSQPFCVQLANEVKQHLNNFINHNCALYLPINVRLLCPKPVKSGYAWGTPPSECGPLGFTLDQKINQLLEKAEYDEVCNNALKNLRAEYGITCPRPIANS